MESNKVAIITGGGRGLGEATVIDLILKGFKVVCADHNELYIDQVANKINKEHFSSFLPCKTDVSNRNDVKNMHFQKLIPLLLNILSRLENFYLIVIGQKEIGRAHV